MKTIMLTAILLISINTFARLTDKQTQFKIIKSEVSITTNKGFHLNAEAPATATFDGLEAIYKPTQKTEKLFVFKAPKNSKVAHLSFYVCDDKKTVCEQQQENIDLGSSAQIEKNENKNSSHEVTAKDISLASADGKPTLLVFSAPWCPACIRMKTETYPVGAVKKQLDKVHFTKLNSDLVENWGLSEKFHVKAIPTLILLNAEGEEVYRWLDFQQAPAFAESLALEITKTANTKEALEKKAIQGDQRAAAQLGMQYYNSLMYAEAVKWLSYSKSETDQKFKLAAEIQDALEKAEGDEKLMPNYLSALEKGIVLTTSEMDQLRWFVDWVDKKKEIGSFAEIAKVKNVKLRLEKLSAKEKELNKLFKLSTYGDTTGFEKIEAQYLIGKLEKALELKEEVNKTNNKIIQLVKHKKLSVKRPGEMLIAIAYLREAEEKTFVTELYQKLRKEYPNTYVYHEKFSKFLSKNQNQNEALEAIEEALKFSEGNIPQLMLTKARILNELKKKELAILTIDLALKQDQIQHERFKSAVAQLKKLKDELLK